MINFDKRTSNIGFTSKIKFVTWKEIEKLPIARLEREGASVGYPYGIDEIAVGKKSAFTEYAMECTAGGIHNFDKLMFFHFQPERSLLNFKNIKKTMIKHIKDMKSQNDKLAGLIVGGYRSVLDSNVFYLKLLGVFSKSGLKQGKNLSVIWGQEKKATTSVFYSVADDTWLVNTKTNYSNDITNLEGLKRCFRKISISDNDELYIGDKRILKTELSSRH